MKENKQTNGKKVLSYYLILAACLLVIAAVTVTVIFSVRNQGGSNVTIDGGNENGENGGNGEGGENDEGGEQQPNENTPTVGANEFILPIQTVNVLNGFTFYKNTTLNNYYLHTGMDFAAEQGEEVYAVLDGVVESVYLNDVLTGTTVTVAHENGIKTTYSFVDVAEGIDAGDVISRGDVIGTVAAPTGKEYKDGAHLHFEVFENGALVDPEDYLNVADK